MLLQPLLVASLALLATGSPVVTARNPVTLPLARRFNFTGPRRMIEIDQDRVKILRFHAAKDPLDLSRRSVFPLPATNEAVNYITKVRVHHHMPILSS